MVRVRYLALLFLIAVPPFTRAASLKQETKKTWDAYLQQANAGMQARLQPGAHFLWLEEEPGRMEYVRTKGPLIGPVAKQIPRKIPNGLIHDWLGAPALYRTRTSKTFCALSATTIPISRFIVLV